MLSYNGRRVKQYDAKPPSHWDRWFWPVLRVFWEPFFIKNSHFWHWRKDGLPISKGLLIKGDPAEAATISQDKMFIHRLWWQLSTINWGRKKVAVLRLNNGHVATYQVGFRRDSDQFQQLCAILLSNTPKVAVTIGAEDCTFYAIDTTGKEWRLQLEYLTFKSKLDNTIPLL